MAAATIPRLYHSTALLLPDGRVVAAAGNPEGGHSVVWEPPDPEEEMRASKSSVRRTSLRAHDLQLAP